MAVSDASLRELGHVMEVLGSQVRLQILRELRDPTRISEIRVAAELSREGEREHRPLSRQAVTHHLEKLQAVGLVKPSPVGGDKRGDAYILNHERLFALTDELRQLNRLRPFLAVGDSLTETMSSIKPGIGQLPRPPRLLEAYGASEGRGFKLPADGRRVVLGRDPGSGLHLDHDPYVSSQHCSLEREEAGWVLTDLDSSNGSWVNWEPAPAGQPVQLASGDLLRVGRTHLVFQG